jgi:hypothetical protein
MFLSFDFSASVSRFLSLSFFLSVSVSRFLFLDLFIFLSLSLSLSDFLSHLVIIYPIILESSIAFPYIYRKWFS